MAAIDSDRNLLFGLLALQNGLIDQGALFAAFAAWTRDKGRSLADHLVTLGHLDAPRRAVVEAIAGLHVQTLGGDPAQSLAVLDVARSTRETLALAGDPLIEATLGYVGSALGSARADLDSESTFSYSVGSATSEGQRFRILRPHAKGGLGAVSVALDSELHREVALKQILERHADDTVSRQRFVAEAEITGGLEHPGVVPVYGLGTDAGGRPYYAMRFIKGDSLKVAIARFHEITDSRELELRKLLRRFLDVCNAVDYAHSRGVIHRDLKPANIIVGNHGETLVVDWGLAKAVGRAEPSVGEQTLAPKSGGSSETLQGSALGTPGYMSPEQARGDLQRLGPRSDVYSLGATLYCLLTGKPPFDGEEIGAILSAVQQGAFPRPSQHVPALDQALEAICLKAMATEPADRYPTPRALADDLERWMADEPVTAWREPLARRARRWARRNRTPVTALAVALVAGVVGLAAVLAVQTRAKALLAASLKRETSATTALAVTNAELTRSRAAVEARYDLAVEAIKTFHTGVSEDFLLKEPQFKEVRDRLLKSASDFYGKLGALLGKASDRASRRAVGQANFEVAELTRKVGIQANALAAHRQVLAAREALAAETSTDPALHADVARSLTAVAVLLETTGGTVEAELTYRKALAIEQKLADDNPAVTEFRSHLANSHDNLGFLLSKNDKSSVAEAEYRQALAIEQKLADDDPAKTDFSSRLAQSHLNLGLLLAITGKSKEAEAECRRALAIQQKVTDDNPAVSEFRSRLAQTQFNLGWQLSNSGKSSQAEAQYRKALAIQQKLTDENPAVTELRSRLAQSHRTLGNLLSDTGKAVEAAAEYSKSLALRQSLADDHPAIPHFRRDLADILVAFGWQLAQAGKTDAAISYYAREEAIRQKLAKASSATPADRDSLANCQTNTADLLRKSGRLGQALAACERSLAVREPLVEAHPEVPWYRAGLGETYLRLGQVRSDMENLAGAAAAWKRGCAHYEGTRSPDAQHTFLRACSSAGLAGIAGRPGSGVSTAEGANHAEKAMALLRQAVSMGYRNADAYRTESALDPLRNRPDFQALILDLVMPTEPFARAD